MFTATQAFTLVSAQYYSPTLSVTNTVTVRLYDQNTSVQIGSNIVLPIVQGATAGFYTMNLNLPITPGNYRITASFTSSVNRHSTGADYSNIAWNNLGPVGVITSGYNSGVVTAEYNYFHNIAITAGCSGPRVSVLANLIAPPAITLTNTAPAICVGQSSNISVSSTNDPAYTYSWTSAPAGFTAATAGPHTVSPTATTIYTVNAVDNTAGPNAGCASSGSTTVTVSVYPTNVTATATPTTLCVGGTVNLTSTGSIPGSYAPGYTMGAGGTTYTDISVTGTSIGVMTDDNQFNITFPAFNYNGVTYTSGRVSNNGWLVMGPGSVGTSGGFSNAALPQASTAFGTLSGNAAVLCPMWDDLLPGASTSVRTQTVGSKFILQWDQEDNFNATGVGTITFQIQMDQSNGKIYFVYPDVTYGDVLADAGLLATVGLNFSSTSALQYSNNTASLVDGQIISFTPNLTAATNFAWVSNPAAFTSAVQNPTGVIPAVTPINYTVSVSNNGCITQATTATVNLTTLAISTPAVLANVLCKGQATGSVSALASGGTPIVGPNPYTYTIAGPTVNTTGLTTGIFTGLLAGNYTITATDGLPCSVTSTSVTVTEPAIILSVTASGSTPITCHNGSNGTITAAAAGGTGAYTYTIAGPTVNTTGLNSGTFTGLNAGSYTITVTDANGCTATTTPATVLTNPAILPITASNSSPVCAGQNVTLSITQTYTTYAWTGPVAITNASSQSATATAPANGDVFTITVTDGNGCSNSATTTVNITALSPVSVTIAVSPGSDNCAGTPLTFTATPVNGGGSPTYKWYINGVEQIGEIASTYLNSTAVDQDVVTCQVTSSVTCVSGNPATSNGITLTVSPFVTTDVTLASNAAANTVCAGTSVIFTATPIFGGASPTYQFFVNAVSQGAASASNTFSYVPVNGDAVTVEITSSLTCSLNGTATSNAVNMTVNPVPAQPTVTVGGPLTFCNGGSVTLTSSFAGAGNQWYKNTVLMPGETNQNLVVTTSGSYTVIYTALACASPVSAATVVTVNANPTATITGTANFCTGSTTTLSAASSTAGSGTISTYQWYEGANPLGTAVTQVVTIAGSYTVVVTNSNTCATTSTATLVVQNAVPTAVITGSSTICTGTTVTLDASTSTAGSGTITTYQWKLGVTNVGANNAQYIATVPGSYTITVTNSNGCSTTSAPFVLAATGPLSGTYTIGSGAASCSNYLSFAAAIGDLNTKGVSGPVTFNVASAYTETAPVGGLIINYCALSNGLKPSATNTVSFLGGAIAATISSQVGTSLTVDGIVKLVGADYITFNKINLQETATNVTATTQMEWGYALLKCDGNDGSNNNTISNCSITLNKANTASVAIYSGNHIATVTTGLTYTGTAGDFTAVSNSMNGRNTFMSNAIQNVYGAFSLNGNASSSLTYSLNDTLNFVGITGAGNTITNFGGAGTLVIVINQTNQRGYRVKNNTITGGTGTTSAVTGISMTSGVWGEIIDNTIQISNSSTTSGLTGITAGFTGGDATNPNLVTITGNIVQGCTAPSSTGVAFTGITTSAGGTGSIINVSSNTVQNNTIGGTGTFTGIANTASPATLTMSSNTITGNTKGSTGTMSLMSVGTPTNSTVNSNSITNNLVLGGSATVTLNCVIGSTSIYTFNGNTISNNRVTGMGGTSIATVSGYTNSGSPTGETITNNNINNLFVTGAATPSTAVQVIRGFQNNTTSSGTRSMSGNTISDLYSSSTLSAGITGIISATGGNVKIFNNKICNLFPGQNAVTLAFAKGISITGGTTDSVYNNLINIDLTGAIAPAADAVLKNSNSVNGIEVTSGTTVKLYFNTIRLAGNGTTNTFGTSGISLTSTTPLVDIRNNIVVNLTTGGALAAANAAVGLRRTSTIALNATGYAATSNNNIWYTAGTAAAPFYYDGTTAYNTMPLFKAQVTARETASQTENVAFQSTACGNANMLKVNTAIATFVEGGAQAIAGITTDYFGTVRSGSSPDIGAHEDNFINLALIITSVSASPSAPQCVATARTITAVLSTLPVATSVTLNYSFAGVAQTPVTMTLVSGSTYTGIIPAAPSSNVLVTWSVTATDGTYTPTATGTSYTDAYLTGITIATSANPTTVCAGSPSVLTAVITGPPLVAPAATSYCASTHTSGCSGDDITNLVLGTISNATTGCGGASHYTYFNAGGSQTTSLAATVSNTLTVSFGTDGNQYFGAWIDYNHNGLYDVAEFLGASANAGASGTISITFTVPVTATNGLTHLRLIGGNDSPLTSAQACGASSSTFGETQDYDVTITGASNAGAVLPGSTFNSYVWRDALNNIVGTAANPTTVNPAATKTYTLTATDVNGCVVVSAPVTVSVVPLVAVNITQGATSCASGVTLTANTTGGGAPFTYVWSDGSATVYPNTQTITTGVLTPGIYTFTVTVTDGCGGNVNMSLGPVTVNPLPTVTITSDPANGLVCGDKVTMTASGASTYAWSPAAGLNVTTGAVVFATPTVNTTYVVTGTDANGCTNTASKLIQRVTDITMSATPPTATVCAGSNLQLNSTASVATGLGSYYSFTPSTGAVMSDTTGATVVVGSSVDDAPMALSGSTAGASQPIGFTFDYQGVSYSHFSASPDGWITLKTSTAAATSSFSNTLTAPSNVPTIAALWDDLATGTTGHVKAVVKGTAPFRRMVFHWFVTIPRNTTGAANANFQIIIYEGSNNIEYRYDAIAGALSSASIGLTSAPTTGQFMSVTPIGTTVSTVTANNAITAAPVTGTQYLFSYTLPSGTIGLSWSPATNLNSTTIANPLATNLQASVNYVLTATYSLTGCSVKDTVIVTVNPLPAATFTGLPSTICSSASAVTLVGTPAGGTFSGPGMSGPVFTPGSAGPGLHTISYAFTDLGTGCSNTTTQQVTVTQPVVSFTGLAGSYCINVTAVTLTGNQAPGGTFTGPGITDNANGTANFNPAATGAGVKTIVYSYTDGNGCFNSTSQNVTVNPLPVVSFTGLAFTYCVTNAAVTLTGTPVGGTFSGTGIVGNTFNPATAGVGGPYTITYTFTNGNGCTGTQQQTVTVNGVSTISLTSAVGTNAQTVCINNAITNITYAIGGAGTGASISAGALPAGVTGSFAAGVFTISGTPTASGNFPYTVTTSGSLCTEVSLSGTITVNANATITLTSAVNTDFQAVCINSPIINITYAIGSGGTGASITAGALPAGVTGSFAAGVFTISGTPTVSGNFSYTVTTSGGPCLSASASGEITVNALPIVSFSGLALTYCSTDPAATLTGSPAGGTFSGTGIVGNTFNPATAGIGGPYTITYSYTNPGTGCTNTSTQQVTVTFCTPTTITVNLKLFLQGYYTGGSTMQPVLNNQGVAALATETDTVTVELHDATTFALIDSKVAVLSTSGLASATFTQAAASYYIAIKHRNTIQTWTANPVACTVSTALYDFSTAANKAFGDNQIEVSTGVWAMYTGDMDQDDFIDGNDFPYYDVDSFNGVNGVYANTDLDGDGFVDGNDYPLYDVNSFNGVLSIHP